MMQRAEHHPLEELSLTDTASLFLSDTSQILLSNPHIHTGRTAC